ncbi:MAG: hypothetical protein Q4B32_06625 [Clostridia bacterium]|nr:hypothetical protein [Clostridia bacterium]
MAGEITRLMVEVAVSQGLQGLKQQFDRRVLRNAVEHGGHFSNGRFQRAVFQTLQDMLRTEDHPYFSLCNRLAADVDDCYFLNYGINLTFESWTRGAAVIRGLEAKENRNIPWCMTLYTAWKGQQMPIDTAKGIIEQGMPLGIMAWALMEEDGRSDVLRGLCDQFPNCAFTAFLPDEKMTDALLCDLEGVDNLALVAMSKSGTFASYEVLRKHRRLFGLCRDVDAACTERMLKQQDLRLQSAPEAPILFFRYTEDCPEEVRSRFTAYVKAQKANPDYPVFPIDLSRDISRVDEIISDDACRLSLAADGTYLVGESKTPAALSFPEASLHDAVTALLLK